MKELIRSLTRKAGFIRLSEDKYAAITEQQVEKFAELIARECAEVALREDHEPSECILKHFGLNR
jgi:hypothetical protein